MANVLDIILRARNLASKELNAVTKQLKGLDNAAKMALGGVSSLAGGFAIAEAAKFAVSMAELNTQVERSTFAFEHFSGGSAQAAANLRAVQRASGGTLTTLEAQNVAVVGLTQGLASNSQELEKMTRIARGIVAVSPIINDVETAFSQLGLTIANQSMMRLDQLGTSAVEVRTKMAELKSQTKGLTDEQAFQDALIGILENKFNALTDAAANQASGLEILRAAWVEYRITASESFGWFDKLARRLGNQLNIETELRAAYKLIENLPPVVSAEQQGIINQIQTILDSPLDAGDDWGEIGEQIDGLIDKFYELGDARTNFFKSLAAGPKIEFPIDDPLYTTDQDQQRIKSLEEAQKVIDKITETQARSLQNQALEQTFDPEFAQTVYETVLATGAELQRQQEAMGRNAADLVPIFQTLLQMNTGWSFSDPERDMQSLRDTVQSLTFDLAAAAKVRVFQDTEGDLDAARQAFSETRNALGDFINQATQDIDTQNIEELHAAYSELLTLLPSVAQMIAETGNAAAGAASGFDMLADGIRNALSAAGKVGTAVTGVTQGIAGTVTDVLSSLADMTSGMEMDLFGIGADFGQGLEGGRKYVAEMLPDVQQMVLAWAQNGATLEEITQILLPNYLSDLESANASLYRTEKGTAAVNDEFNTLKSTISGIVSGAIGPVAGVDANDLLPREDAVNENARRLADIAVNGFKGQEWLDEFAMEAPDVFEQLKNSSDPKATAAQILKDFQDGLVPELLDKDRAKDLVRRALQGDENTKQLIDEIAADLANEFGISVGDAKAKASEVLGGGEGATGVSLAPKIDATAAESAASAFASSFNAAISGSTIGADLSGTIMTQVMASVAVIEASGNEAGKALVKGVTATFTDIPAAFIAAVAALVTPAVQASINQNGGRTGAAAV